MKKSERIEILKMALSSIRAQMMRAILTISIIAIGIMALVGILTTIDAIKNSLTDSFAQMGSNTFSIQSKGMNIQIGNNGIRSKRHPYITYEQASSFIERMDFPCVSSVNIFCTQIAEVKYQNFKTNKNITVQGIDNNYLYTAGYALESGRDFTATEIEEGRSVVIIGLDIVEKLFPNEDPIDKIISLRNNRFRVIGVLESKGSGIGFGGDNICMIPYTKGRVLYSRPNMDFNINVSVFNPENMDAAIGEATSVMRMVRKQKPKEESSFNISKSDNLSQMLIQQLGFVVIAGVVIGVITLFGASIGLMNIMLVSVTDRTREIGVRKAMGAKKSSVRYQFLTEAIIICLFGGIAGVILGIGAGNILSLVMGGSFFFPFNWVFLGLSVCVIVGVVSGIYPALKASNLDPIEALRHE